MIKAADWSVHKQRTQSIEAAELQAAAIVERANQAAQDMMALARAQVKAQEERGYQMGLSRAQQQHAEKVALQSAKAAQTWESYEDRMCRLVTKTLQNILTEPDNDKRFFESAISRVLAVAKSEKHLYVRVNQDQSESARRAVEALILESGVPNFIEVVEDKTLARGSCVVESSQGVADASLATHLEAIETALKSHWGANRG